MRRILNFGHTFGHAVEALTGVSHGEAVSIGMVTAARWSVAECNFPQTQLDRLRRLLCRLGLPVITDALPDDILRTLLKDKKRENDYIHLVLLNKIGEASVHKTSIKNITGKISQTKFSSLA
jgi:3-dehydroquinate synthase